MRGALCPLGHLLVQLLGVLTVSAAPFYWGDQEKIALRDIKALTLYPNELTYSRRSTVQIPQLQCIGGTSGCSANTPEFAICYNRGWDGTDVQWECKVELDNSHQIGRAVLNCEGYDYPEDPYVLKGSCGLQYTLDFSNANQTMFDGYDSLTFSLGILLIILLGTLAYGFFKISCSCDLPPPRQRLQFPVRAGRPSLGSSEDPGFWSRTLNGMVPENMLSSWRTLPDSRRRLSNYQHPPDNQQSHCFSPLAHLPQSAFITASSFPTETRNTFSTSPAILPNTTKMQGKEEEEDNTSMARTSE